MKLLISLDYELFFGAEPGTIENCLLIPVTALLKVVDPYDLKLSFFVDAGFLNKLSQEAKRYLNAAKDKEKIEKHLYELKTRGHDIQLHIHPHWEDSFYNGYKWQINTTRYRLHDFSSSEVKTIVKQYKTRLSSIVGEDVFAFRAGGWCLQPFQKIAAPLLENDIWLDSTVFAQGKSEDRQRWFDFSESPAKSYWRFDSDPIIEDNNGPFLEVAISSHRVLPLFFLKLAASKILSRGNYISYGDGYAMKANAKYYLHRLTHFINDVVSLDGLKADLLGKAYKQLKRRDKSTIFNIMGHPKSLTPNSLKKLERFIKMNKELEPITFQDLKCMKP